MRLCSFSVKQNPHQLKIGVAKDEYVVDLREGANELDAQLKGVSQALEAGWFNDMLALVRQGDAGINMARAVADQVLKNRSGARALLSAGDVKLHAPLARPGKILAVGRNYQDHVAEIKAARPQEGAKINTTDFPRGFCKLPSGVIGPDDDILYPHQTKELDYEAEIALVIGREAKNVKAEDAFQYIVGYTILNDISARDWQRGETSQGMLLLGKNFDTFCPMGPVLVTRDEIPDPNDLAIGLKVNGGVRQDSNTKYMIFNVPQLVAHWSMTRLEPGDVISCGTPSGVATAHRPDPTPFYLKPGDVVEATVEKIGTLRNRIVAEPD